MLTAAQCETVAYLPPDSGELYCEQCFERGGVAMVAVSQYEASEYQSGFAEGAYDDADGHVDDCGCEPALECAECYGEILEAYDDYQCKALDDDDDGGE